jgi:hypothetical protein
VIAEKMNYINYNQVEEGLVFRSEDYVYSSARDYNGEKGLLNDVIVLNLWNHAKGLPLVIKVRAAA